MSRVNLALAIGVTVVTSALAGTGAELATRYWERHRVTVPGTKPLLFYRHRWLEHAMVRNADYFGWVHVNAQGFRGPDIAVDKPPGVLRVIALGGATTFLSLVSRDDRAWPA